MSGTEVETPLVGGQLGGVGVQPGVVFTVGPNRSTGLSVCLLRTKDSTAIGVKSWILFVSLRFVAGGSVGWSVFYVLEILFHSSTGNRSPRSLMVAEEQGVAASLTKAHHSLL